VCPSCSHRFPIKPDYVKQFASPLAPLKPGEADPLMAGTSLPTPTVPPSEATPPPDQLSQIRPPTIVPGPAPAAPQAAAPPPPPPVPPREPVGSSTDRRAQRLVAMQEMRRKRMMMMVAGGLICIVLMLAGVVLYRSMDRALEPVEAQDLPEVASVVSDTAATDKPEPPRVQPVDDDVPVISAVTMCTWYTADEPATNYLNAEPFELQSAGFARVGGEHLFEAILAGRIAQPNAPTTFRLGLVDGEGRVFAWYDQPLLIMMGGQIRERINVTLSDKLRQRATNWVFVVVKGKPIGGGDRFKHIEITDLNDTIRTTVRVSAYNPLQREVARAVIVLTAYDKADVPVGRWLVEWDKPIGPGQRVEFQSLLSSRRDIAAQRWGGDGVALIKAAP
jgi:hypothetical protein